MTIESMDDTIAAVATGSGPAGVAIVRVSGPRARSIGRRLGLELDQPRRATVDELRTAAGRPVDRVVATWFAGPASYTGEDVVEIGCHGGALVPQLVLDAVLEAGARLARPGEFTRRAYLNGKLDLVQAEATLDLVDATSEAHHAAALFQLSGALSRRVESLRRGLIELLALLGYDIDFPEEDDGPVPAARIEARAESLTGEIDTLLAGAPEGEQLRDGVLTVIAGRPNAGKSSLFNAMLGEERAIVTEVPGTTRDAIEARVSIDGYPFRLVDTAGLRDRAERIEEMGIEVARRYLDRADLVLLCVESGRAETVPEETLAAAAADRGQTVVWVQTKRDLAAPLHADRSSVSARDGEGLAELRGRLADAAFGGLRRQESPPLITRRRQRRSVERARSELIAFLEAFSAGIPAEVAATHLEDARLALEELVGLVEHEDVLDRLFASFCVGK